MRYYNLSYNISFRVKVEGVNKWISVGSCDANTTWNVGTMIRKCTSLAWENEKNNGLVKDIIPYINKGLYELTNFPEKYKKYEAKNGWGTIKSTIRFFKTILDDWDKFKTDYRTEELVDVVYFWIT